MLGPRIGRASHNSQSYSWALLLGYDGRRPRHWLSHIWQGKVSQIQLFGRINQSSDARSQLKAPHVPGSISVHPAQFLNKESGRPNAHRGPISLARDRPDESKTCRSPPSAPCCQPGKANHRSAGGFHSIRWGCEGSRRALSNRFVLRHNTLRHHNSQDS